MGSAIVLRADAGRLPLPDCSVDLIVTSPPYWSLRSYRDGGESLVGQMGSEPTPAAFLEALWAVMRECWRVLKPSGSMFVNLGDKRSGSGAPGTTSGLGGPSDRNGQVQGERSGRSSYSHDRAAEFGRPKSKMLLPQRFAIGCEDGAADPEGIGWIVRQEIVWDKPNGMPEPVRDRTRDNHEAWWHLTKRADYFAALDEIREPHTGGSNPGRSDGKPPPDGKLQALVATGDRAGTIGGTNPAMFNPLGRLPSSVWRIPTEPLMVPDWLRTRMRAEGREEDHFAAFPTEWPRRLILGWSPSGICTACGDGRAPIVEKPGLLGGDNNPDSRNGTRAKNGIDGGQAMWEERTAQPDRIIGYACACPDTSAPTRPAVVLDPFGGTGTTAMVARALGRHGISIDLSRDYNRLAQWRIWESDGAAKVADRTAADRQGTLL